MGKKKKKKKHKKKHHPEAKGLLLLAFSLLLFLSLFSFDMKAPSSNWLGLLGHYTAWGFNYIFGLCSYLLILFSSWIGWEIICYQRSSHLKAKIIYFSLFLISCSILLNLIAESTPIQSPLLEKKVHTESIVLKYPFPHLHIRYNLGGIPTYYLYRDLPGFNLQKILSNVGIGITFSLSAIVFFLLMTGMRITHLLEGGKNLFLALWESFKNRKGKPFEAYDLSSLEKEPPEQIEKRLTKTECTPIQKEVPPIPRVVSATTRPILKEIKGEPKDFTSYRLPPPSLLTNPKKVDKPLLKKELLKRAQSLEETLNSFGIKAKVGDINCGPTIASFEVHPDVGVKVQKIKALENDIALNLQAKSLRIIAPIPGKAAVGIEIPSIYPQEVSFKELLFHYKQQPRKYHIPILLGKTVSGDNVMSDLTRMPHCMIAGATGSGKSVCINTIVMSVLMNARPDEVKMLMIDPKRVELSAYSHLPHMIAPVITEPHGAYSALNWLVKEMQFRYEVLKQLGLRNIGSFNNRKVDKELEASLSIEIPEKMPFLVAIIDEFADLMMVSSTDLETPIARIAQMARAVGIHLILATQRPSREVITGLIKANFPTRIAFKVSSRINSQIILDENGAESLLGNGDMLFLPPGSSHTMRAQGAFVSDEEIHRVISFITDQAPPNYQIPSFDKMSSNGDLNLLNSPQDELLNRALEVVLHTKNASTTFLQRKLKIGYARAASLIDELEAKGIVGPQDGNNKGRKVLFQGTPNDFQKQKNS